MAAMGRCGAPHRVFRDVVAAARSKAPAQRITAMTYNILAEKYTRGGWHSYCPSPHLSWESRRQRILDEIESYSSDIICLQEVEAGVFSGELQPWLAERGYRGHYLARQYGENVQGPPEGVALFYRTAVFDLVQQHSFLFNSVPTQPPAPLSPALSSGSDIEAAEVVTEAAMEAATEAEALGAAAGAGATPPAGVGDALTEALEGEAATATATAAEAAEAEAAVAMAAGVRTLSVDLPAEEGASRGGSVDGPAASTSGRGRGHNEFWRVFQRRHEGAILALLRHRSSRKVLLVAVTHLFWNPYYADVKAFQAAVLCQEMSVFLRRHCGPDAPGAVPVMLCGDFNSLADKRVPDAFDSKIPRDGLASGVYALLTRGSLPPSHPDHPASRRRPGETGNRDFRGVPLTTSGLRLASSYFLAHGCDPPLTTRTNSFAGCLDYIFVSPQHLEVVRTLELPYDNDSRLPYGYGNVRDPMTVDFPPIPNDVFPSDHLSLAAVLHLRD